MIPRDTAAEVLARVDEGLARAEPALGRVFGRRRVALVAGCVQFARGLVGARPAIEVTAREVRG